MSTAANKLDVWIRGRFIELNSALEELYLELEDPADIIGIGSDIKEVLRSEGEALIVPLVEEGNTERRFDSAYDVLGNVGLYMAALRRHELMNPDRESQSPFEECSAVAMHIAASIGVAPRFATAHLATHNRAVNGRQKSFTSLPDEKLFNDLNLIGVLAYKRAGAALMRLSSIGVEASAAAFLLQDAKDALEDVARSNKQLYDQLDINKFFYHVRPYFKSYHVGGEVFRGANAGDFAGINQIDLLLGLCRGNDREYAQLLEEKILYMTPEDQRSLRDCLALRPFVDEFVKGAKTAATTSWFKNNAALFLDVCTAHGRTATQHHDMLVRRFIDNPSRAMNQKHLKQVTASGPPLGELLTFLENLRDRRTAAERHDIPTAYAKISIIREALGR